MADRLLQAQGYASLLLDTALPRSRQTADSVQGLQVRIGTLAKTCQLNSRNILILQLDEAHVGAAPG